MAAAELIDAVKALRLENPEIGVKKIAASVKAQGLGGAKEVRQALADISAAEDAASPAVSPSKSPVKADEAAGSASAAPAESARQQKMRERQEAAAAAAAERKLRERRKRTAFSKLFPDLDVQAAFGPGVDRRVQAKAKAEIQAKLTDQNYVTSAVLEGRLSPQEMQELVEDMKAGGFTPSLPESDDEDGDDEDGEAHNQEQEEGHQPVEAGLGLPAFGGQAAVSGTGLPSFGNQKA
jgi:hypothetical protein